MEGMENTPSQAKLENKWLLIHSGDYAGEICKVIRKVDYDLEVVVKGKPLIVKHCQLEPIPVHRPEAIASFRDWYDKREHAWITQKAIGGRECPAGAVQRMQELSNNARYWLGKLEHEEVFGSYKNVTIESVREAREAVILVMESR